MTRMFSDRPGTPGSRQQMPRTIRSICTPACDARYSAAMIAAVDERVALQHHPRRLRRVVLEAQRQISSTMPLAQLARRHPQLAVALRAAEAGQVVEQVGHVGGESSRQVNRPRSV